MVSFRMYSDEAESRRRAAQQIAFEDLAITDVARQRLLVPMSAAIGGERKPVLPAFKKKDEASFSGSKSNYVCLLVLPLKRWIGVRRPMPSSVSCGIQIGALTVGIPSGEPAAPLIEEEQITYPFQVLPSNRSGLFPVPPSIDGSKHQEV